MHQIQVRGIFQNLRQSPTVKMMMGGCCRWSDFDEYENLIDFLGLGFWGVLPTGGAWRDGSTHPLFFISLAR